MAGEPALTKILTALGALVDAVAGTATVDVDQPDDESLDESELKAVNIIHIRTAFAMHEHGVQEHRATIDLDMVTGQDADETNAEQLRNLEADLVAALWAGRTLGGIAQDIILLSSGGDEDVRAEVGARPLSIEVLYLTPLGDHRTIIGAAGLVP